MAGHLTNFYTLISQAENESTLYVRTMQTYAYGCPRAIKASSLI